MSVFPLRDGRAAEPHKIGEFLLGEAFLPTQRPDPVAERICHDPTVSTANRFVSNEALATVTGSGVRIANEPMDLVTYSITETWRILVKARMADLKLGPVELAKLAGVTHGTINHMLSTTKASPHVADVHKALGWPEPAVSEDSLDDDPRLVEIGRGWERLPEADRDFMLATFRRLLPVG